MFVAGGAVLKLREKRKKQFYGNYIEAMITEAKRLRIDKSEIQSMIESGYEQQ
jgi:DNA-binding transcriptional regulator YhcF (GntR family)